MTTNIRQAINDLSTDAETRVLRKAGIVSEFGNITALGRRIQADLQFKGKKGTKAELVAAVQAVVAAEKAAKELEG